MLKRGTRYAQRLALTALALVAVLVLAGLLIAHFRGGNSKGWVEGMLFGGGATLFVVFGLAGGLSAGPVRLSRGGVYIEKSPPALTFGTLLVPIAVICAGVLVHLLG